MDTLKYQNGKLLKILIFYNLNLDGLFNLD
jgi:hypothetical protein